MYYLGIDLGGMSIKAGVCDINGNIIYKSSVPTVRTEDGDRVVKDMAALCLDVISKAGLTVEDIAYAGISSPGTADPVDGIIVYACSLPFLNYPIAEKLSALTGISKIYVENDANAAAKGEATVGAAKGYKDSIMITIGTGVGGGIIIDGKVYSGFNFAGGELGHIVIVHDGAPCSCGRNGCWESYASASALISQTREAMKAHPESFMWQTVGSLDKVDGRTAFEGAENGDATAKQVIDRYISYLACGLVNIINIFQPEVLSIGGGVSNAGDALLLPLIDIIKREQYSRNSPKQTLIKIARLGNDAGIIGSAMLGL